MPNVVQRRVALLSDDGKFADSMTPQLVLDIRDQVQQIEVEIDAHLAGMLAKSANLADVPSPTAARQNLGAAAAQHTHQQSDIDGLTDALAAKADLVDGFVPTAQIPTRALVTAVPVGSQAAMLALTPEQVQPGDIAIRSDGAGTFMLLSPDPSQLGSWTLLAPPTDSVITVNGQSGAVILSAADVGAATPAQVASAVSAVEITAEGYAAQAAGSATSAADSATAAAGSAFSAGQSKTGAETAKLAAEKARDETEQVYVLLGNVSGTKTLTLAETDKPTGWDATLTANTDFVLPSLGNRILTCSLLLTAGVAGVTYRILGGKLSYGQSLVHSGALNGVDLVHLLHFGPRGWIVLAGAAALSVPAGWVS